MIVMNELTYSYPQNHHLILNKINLCFQKGEWVTITGSNGSGKSTLARMINGLSLPNEGTVAVDGLDIFNKKELKRIRQKVQLVFQNPDSQLVGSSPIEDIAFGLENRGIAKEEMYLRIRSALNDVNLLPKWNARVSELSGGEKQRLAIASCLALTPEYMIFDESTSMLDPIGRKDILSIAQSLWKKGMTVIWITQHLNELGKSKRIIVMEKGRIAHDTNPRELFYLTDIPERFHWDLPPTIKIGNLLKDQGIPIDYLPLCEEDLEDYLCKLNSPK